MKYVPARWFTTVRPDRPRKIDLVVLHAMQAPEKPGTAEAVARYFQRLPATAKASAHYCVDSDSIVQCVIERNVAYHAPGANHNGVGVEHAGYSEQSAKDWDDVYSRRMLKRSARLTADICLRHSIPVRFVTAAGLKRGVRGITTHNEVSLAFGRSTHWDPGPGFPIREYVARVRGLTQPPKPRPARVDVDGPVILTNQSAENPALWARLRLWAKARKPFTVTPRG